MSLIEWLGTGLLVALGATALLFKKFYMPNGEIESLPEPVNEPVDTPVSPEIPSTSPVKPKSMIDTFCEAIKTFEGANPANNNPGNCRCSPVGYLPKYGNVKCNPHGFAVFPTYELGYEYLQNLVLHRATVHPEWTILDFFNVYAPASDNNPPVQYAKFVADRCGISPSTTLANVFGLV